MVNQFIFKYLSIAYKHKTHTKYIFTEYFIFKGNVSFALQLYLDAIVKFKPEIGKVDIVVAHDIKKVIAKIVWFAFEKKSANTAICYYWMNSNNN